MLRFEPKELKTKVNPYLPDMFTRKMLLEVDMADFHAFSIDFDIL
jgi:hypothetical protein